MRALIAGHYLKIVSAKFRRKLPIGGRGADFTIFKIRVRRRGEFRPWAWTVAFNYRPGGGCLFYEQDGVVNLRRDLFGKEVGGERFVIAGAYAPRSPGFAEPFRRFRLFRQGPQVDRRDAKSRRRQHGVQTAFGGRIDIERSQPCRRRKGHFHRLKSSLVEGEAEDYHLRTEHPAQMGSHP